MAGCTLPPPDRWTTPVLVADLMNMGSNKPLYAHFDILEEIYMASQ